MARYGSRSRSPSSRTGGGGGGSGGGGYSKRSRDDRYDPRGSRPRSRSRDVRAHPAGNGRVPVPLKLEPRQRRDYRDRDHRDRGGRRDKSTDRRRRDDYYDSRDDRRRDERPKDKERVRVRDKRDGGRRSRSRDSVRCGDRSRRDRDRDADRERGGEGRRDDHRRGDRERGKEVRSFRDGAAPPVIDKNDKSPTTAQTEDEKIRQRRERLEAWKKKKAEEEAQKKAASPAAMLSELERQRSVSVAPITSKPGQGTPKVPAQQVTTSASLSNSNTPRPKADQGSSAPPSASLGMCLSSVNGLSYADPIRSHEWIGATYQPPRLDLRIRCS